MKEHEGHPDDQRFPVGEKGIQSVPPGGGGLEEDTAPGLIDLTDIVEPIGLDELGPDLHLSPTDDTLIDLIEPINSKARSRAAQEMDTNALDDNIFDLFEIADGSTSIASRTVPPGLETDMIDLTDPVSPVTSGIRDEPVEENENIIRLDDILNSERDTNMPLFDFSDPIPPSVPPVLSSIDEGHPAYGHLADEPPLELTPTRIEQAIERMIEAKYGLTIEQMIAETVEKVVLREMRSLKRSLMEGEDDLIR